MATQGMHPAHPTALPPPEDTSPRQEDASPTGCRRLLAPAAPHVPQPLPAREGGGQRGPGEGARAAGQGQPPRRACAGLSCPLAGKASGAAPQCPLRPPPLPRLPPPFPGQGSLWDIGVWGPPQHPSPPPRPVPGDKLWGPPLSTPCMGSLWAPGVNRDRDQVLWPQRANERVCGNQWPCVWVVEAPSICGGPSNWSWLPTTSLLLGRSDG